MILAGHTRVCVCVCFVCVCVCVLCVSACVFHILSVGRRYMLVSHACVYVHTPVSVSLVCVCGVVCVCVCGVCVCGVCVCVFKITQKNALVRFYDFTKYY